MDNELKKSFFIIKPEAFNFRDEIKKTIISSSILKIVDTKEILLSEADINDLYFDDCGTPLINAIKLHMVGKKVEVGVVQGSDAVRALIKVCGESFIPLSCLRDTIRWRYGLRDTVWYGEIEYYLNAIHRASQNEVEQSLYWFEKKFRK